MIFQEEVYQVKVSLVDPVPTENYIPSVDRMFAPAQRYSALTFSVSS